MITCKHAKHLFDRYLDGELSPSLQAELHAHQLSCSGCQGDLALLEACGDVIAYDDCEPRSSASFTDRVLLAHRAQLASRPRRRWSRLIISVASPIAAAACIVFAVLLIVPTTNQPRLGMVKGTVIETSKENANVSQRLAGKEPAAPVEPQFATVRQMPAGFADVILNSVVEQTRNTAEGTKRSLEQLESLIGLGFAGANETLAAGWRNLESERQSSSISQAPKVTEPDMLAPSFPCEAPATPEPSRSADLDDTVEAL